MTAIDPPDGEEAAWAAAREEVGAVLAPDSVAIVGASNTEGKTGNILLRNILQNDYGGDVYPINPSADEVLGIEAYESIGDVPGDVDTVLFAVPGGLIKDMIPACGEKGVTCIVIVAAGFAEAVDEDRQALQAEIAALCAEHGIRAVGPNTTGMVSKKNDFVASFIPFPTWEDGSLAMLAQTGILAGVYMEEVMHREVQRLGYNYSLAVGNKMDLNELDFVRYAGQDEDVEVIQLHLEDIDDPAAFFPTAAHVASHKPIVLLKGSRTPEGRAASRWHTASHAAPFPDVENACRASGIVLAGNFPEFMNYAKGFQYQPAPRGRNVAVLSFSGANAVLAADHVSESRLALADLADETLERVKELVPDWQPVRNPVDQWLALPAGHRESHEEPLHAVLEDDGVDAVVAVHLATEPADFEGIDEMYEAARAAHPEKPILGYIMGADIKDRWVRELEGTGIPLFDSSYEAIDTLEAMYWWRLFADGEGSYDDTPPAPGKTI